MIKRVLTDKSLWGFTAIALLMGSACYLKGGGEAVRRGLGRLGDDGAGRSAAAGGFRDGRLHPRAPAERRDHEMGWRKIGLSGDFDRFRGGFDHPSGPLLAFPLLATLYNWGRATARW